ncbi:MAG: thioredoxin family protein [Bacteroidota bacterium]
MRTCWLAFSILFSTFQVSAAGIEFSQGSWFEIMALAKTQQKLVFVEAYADWCNICKTLERNTFRDKQVGELFNEQFINYRFDMEKGEGPDFSEKFGIEGYPTLLFINYRGELVHSAEGYMAPPRLMAEARAALDPGKNQTLLALQVEAGSQDPKVLYNYALNLKENRQDYREAAKKYFATQSEKELLNQENWKAIQTFTTDLNSREFQYLLNKQKKFIRKYGLQAVADKIYGVLKQNTLKAALTRDQALFQEVLATAKSELKDRGLSASRLRMVYAEGRKDWRDYAYKTTQHFEDYLISSAEELHNAARNFYDHVDGSELLSQALAWAQQAVAIDNNYEKNETYALLLYKLGRENEAKTQAFKTWQMGRLNDQVDTSDIEDLLKKLGSPVN